MPQPLSLRQYMAERAADPSEGVVVLLPGASGLPVSIRDLVLSTAAYSFAIENFEIRNTRAVDDDTDLVSLVLQIDGRSIAAVTKAMGDVDNGVHWVRLTIDAATVITPESRVAASYIILNKGDSSIPNIMSLGEHLGYVADFAGAVLGMAMSSAGPQSAILSKVTDLLKKITSILTANCDGVVAIDAVGPLTGRDLAQLTENSGYYAETRIYPPDSLDPDSEVYKKIYTSNIGCGSDSDYSVTWSISRAKLPARPNLAPHHEFFSTYHGTVGYGPTSHPGAAAFRDKGQDCISVFLVDRFGWLWERRLLSSWPRFVNRGAPPGAVAIGSPSVVATPTGCRVFVIGEAFTADDPPVRKRGLFQLHRADDSWRWTDLGPPTTGNALPHLSVVATASGYIGAFLISETGSLWERRFWDGWQPWRPCGSPPNTVARAPSAVVDSSGRVRVFVTAKNGNLYECWPDEAAWFDHGRPPDNYPVGGSFFTRDISCPVFAGLGGYVGGLVIGHNRHVYHLLSTDGSPFRWVDHGTPPFTCGAESWDDLGLVRIGVERGSPSYVLVPGYMGALVVGDNGYLSELYRADDGSWQWSSIGRPPQVPPSFAPSDPCYIADLPQYRRAFLSGNDGRLYELDPAPSGHNWIWSVLGE